MKRFILLIMVLVLIAWVFRTPLPRHPRREPSHWTSHDVRDRYRAPDDRNEGDGALGEVREALHEARTEIRDAWKEVRNELNDAYHEARESVTGKAHRVPPAPPVPPFPAEPAVAIAVSSSPKRAVGSPSISPTDSDGVRLDMSLSSGNIKTVAGQISATEERARDDARRALLAAVHQWLGPDVATSWPLPDRLVNAMIRSSRLEPVIKDYGTLYIAELEVDTSPARRAAFVKAYNRETVKHRLFALGGSLAFVLTCLAAFTGYVRADEATKGYYTNRLRTLVAAGLGAAGVVIYQMVS
jgi:hypothetical protein